MKRLMSVALISLAAASLSGCSVWNSWFGDDKTKPAPLETLSGPATGRILWSTRFNGVSPGSSVPAGANTNNLLVIADGQLQALNRRTGARDWTIHVPHLPATSVVANDKFAYYTAANGEVVSFKVPATAEQLRGADFGNLATARLVTKLVDVQMGELNRSFAAAVDKAAKAAPTGSEFAFAAVKQAVSAANQAYDAITRAGKQVAEMTETTVTATANAVSPKKKAA